MAYLTNPCGGSSLLNYVIFTIETNYVNQTTGHGKSRLYKNTANCVHNYHRSANRFIYY